jgi:hypothetical protein
MAFNLQCKPHISSFQDGWQFRKKFVELNEPLGIYRTHAEVRFNSAMAAPHNVSPDICVSFSQFLDRNHNRSAARPADKAYCSNIFWSHEALFLNCH